MMGRERIEVSGRSIPGKRNLKSPFHKGGFRGIIKALFIIPPAPLYKRGEFLAVVSIA
jgi:hypothetical protein